MSRMSELAAEVEQDEQARAWEMEELHRDVERVCELACKGLSPTDQNLLRWACGVQKAEQPKEQMAMWNPDAAEPPF